MNILIPLGHGSQWNDNELRYCLRGIEKNLTGWENVFIVGAKPDWLQNVTHIPFNDRVGARHKEFNIYSKIMAGINNGIGDDFLFMNDDHFILQPTGANTFPYHHKGPMSQCIELTSTYNQYRRTLMQTSKLFNKPFNWDTHAPIVYNSALFQKALPTTFPAYGYGIKTMYCERNKIKGEFYPDCKLGAVASVQEIEEAVNGRLYFSIGNKAIGKPLEEFLEMQYPLKSKFEI